MGIAAVRRALGIVVAAVACLAGSAHAAATQYVYDNLGRLIAVVDEAGNATTYSYDPAGNLISVTREGTGTLSVTAFSPDHGKAGDAITILGTRFVPGAGANTVSFNGTPATVVSATASTIVATVPAGATAGPVTVSNANGSAASAKAFTVLAAPVISAVTPTIVAQGMSTRVEIAGSRLAFATSVTFAQPGITATILPGGTGQALPLTLNVAPTVPAGSYDFSVSNAAGTNGSGSVSVTVGIRPTGDAFANARPLSVFLPQPPQLAPTAGDSQNVTAPVSVFLPPAAQIAPTVGDSQRVAAPVSVFLPQQSQLPPPTGDSMSVARPVSVSMP